MTDVPDNYVNITSGLGDANPRSIILVPLKFNDNVFGVIEMASFDVYQDYQIEFIEKVGESIASTISTVKVNIRTVKLLEESKLKSEELAAQEEEMRQNMEELQTTQEESARRETEMNGILNALNDSYLVAELDLDGNIISINDNAANMLQKPKEQVEGSNIKDFQTPEEINEFEELWQMVIDGNTAKRQRYINRANTKILITESYTPIYDEMDQLFKVLNIGIEVEKD
jgi:PAS domain-containing protein